MSHNYYSYGMLEPLRSFSNETYKFGFNGKLSDDEIKGSGNSYDFGSRMQDPRTGRFFSIDPQGSKFPYLSPYLFAANNPILFTDKNGEGPEIVVAIVGGVAITVSDAVLISLGVISTGIILHKASDGSLAVNSNIIEWLNPPDRSKLRYETRNPDFFIPKSPLGPREPFDPEKLTKLTKWVIGTGLAARAAESFYKNMKPDDPGSSKSKGLEPTYPSININLKDVQMAPSSEPQKVDVTLKYDVNYTVQKGDNLTKIADMFHTSVNDLASANSIKDKDAIQAGQVLKVGGGTYSSTEDMNQSPVKEF